MGMELLLYGLYGMFGFFLVGTGYWIGRFHELYLRNKATEKADKERREHPERG